MWRYCADIRLCRKTVEGGVTLKRVLILLVLALIVTKCLYPCPMEVVDLDGDIAVMESHTGHLFAIYADDLEIGDRVCCIMFTSFTLQTVEDDIVLRACVW